MSKDQRPTAGQGKGSKGVFRGSTGGRGLHAAQRTRLWTVTLEVGHLSSDQCPLGCFKYSSSSVPGVVCSQPLESCKMEQLIPRLVRSSGC